MKHFLCHCNILESDLIKGFFSTPGYLKYSTAIWTSLYIELSKHPFDTDQQHSHSCCATLNLTFSFLGDRFTTTHQTSIARGCLSHVTSCFICIFTFKIAPSIDGALRWPQTDDGIFYIQLRCSSFVQFTFKCSSGPIRFNFSTLLKLTPGQL